MNSWSKKILSHYRKIYKKIAFWAILGTLSCACLTWQLFIADYFVDADGVIQWVKEDIDTCVSLFIVSLFPIYFLGTAHYGCKKLKLDTANGLFFISTGIFLINHFFFSGIELYSDAPIRVTLLMFVIALFSVGTIDIERQWYVQMLCLSFEAVLFIKLLQKEAIMLSVYFAFAEVAFILSCFWMSHKHIGVMDMLKIISIPIFSILLSVSVLVLTQRDTVILLYKIWTGAEENSLTWFSAANAAEPLNSAYMHAAMVFLNLAGLGTLLLAAKRISMRAQFVAQMITIFDLLTIAYGVAVWYNIIPTATDVFMPFSSTISMIIITLICNSFLYVDHIVSREKVEKIPIIKTIFGLLDPFDDND